MSRRYRASGVSFPDPLMPGSASMPVLPMPNSGLYNFAGPVTMLQRAPESTVQQWRSYQRLSAPHKGPLERGARWRRETKILEQANRREAEMNSTFKPSAVSWAADAQSGHVQSRRNLQRQLREAKDFVGAGQKRAFVPGLVASEDVSHHMADEQRKVATSMLRIQGAIRDCSRARQELVTMQKSMAAVVNDDDQDIDKRKNKRAAGDGFRRALGSQFAMHLR